MNLNELYNREQFISFLEKFLPDYKHDQENIKIDRGYKYIKSIAKLGISDNLDLKIYEVEHSSEKDPRVSISREIFNFLKTYSVSQALVIFKSHKSENYRLSLITSKVTWTEGDKVKSQPSNPRRFSYFLGPDAKVNTPYQFLIKKGQVENVEDLKSRFSIEVVNKEFYKEISKHFIQLVGGTLSNRNKKKEYKALLKLPSVKDQSQISLEFAVRLIGRIIFCWFLREKKSSEGISLMPKNLLSLKAAEQYNDYYHKILEPIFFEILNRPVSSRKTTYDDDLFTLFSSIPYLNGGLFSPQDDDYFSYSASKQAVFHNTVVVPDEWFKSFFRVLETYNFTIDENTSFDEELSIDPEMLGRIFENLLAEINPETGESARKSTGSYYTPRTIVDYMIDESLFYYLKGTTGISEEKLRAIISYDLTDDSESSLNENEKEKIVTAIENMKILDPACGSGAFPIGALQKIVFILQQIDPDGQLWFKKQIKNTSPEIKRVLEREFANKNFDYIRKLGVIRENIYGIDIQPIATEISRLRCFLTLVVDQRVDDKLENRGIEPLPNLDFKFVTANTLIGLPELNTNQMELFDDLNKIEQLKDIRNQYFNAIGEERIRLMMDFSDLQTDMVKEMIARHSFQGVQKAELTNKLTDWKPFKHKSTPWFDPEWMFGIKEGFDIIIANPPYVRADNPDFKSQRDEIKKSALYKTLYEKWDLFVPFIERGLGLLSNRGCLCYITSNSLLTSKFAHKLLNFIQNNYSPQFVDYFSDNTKVFDAGVVPVVFGITKQPITNHITKTAHEDRFGNIIKKENILREEFRKKGKEAFKPSTNKFHLSVDTLNLGDICYLSVGMVLNADEKRAKGLFKTDDLISEVRTEVNSKPYVEAKDISNWTVKKIRFLEWDSDRCPKLIRRKTFPELYEHPKLMIGSLTGGIYDDTGLYTHHGVIIAVRYINLKAVNNKSINTSIKKYNSVSRQELEGNSNLFNLKFLLAIINSKFANKYLNNIRRHRLMNYFYPDDFRKLPIVNISLEKQQPLIDLVDQIIQLTETKDYLQNEKNQKLVKQYEREINQMIYSLYGLSQDEIATIEDSTK